MAQIAEAGQETAGVRYHRGPNATSGTANVPLATDVVRLLEDDWLEPVAPQIPRGDDATGTAPNDCNFPLSSVSRRPIWLVILF
jgi:hypothetical protein